MALSTGTYINAFPVRIPERQEVTRIPLPRPGFPRRELEREHDVPLFVYAGYAWTAATVAGQERVELAADEHLPVHLFNLREALRLRAEELRWDFWIRQGEMSAVKPDAKETIGPFITQSSLVTRAVWEGVQAKQLLLVASSSVRWLVDRPLSDRAVQSVAVGEHVLRRAEAETRLPRRGRVEGFADGQVLLADRADGRARPFRLDDYQLVARPALVHRLVGALGGDHAEATSTYNELLAASGSLLREDRTTPNQFAAKQRYTEAEELLGVFSDWKLTFANDSEATIARTPREVYPVRKGPAREPWSAAIMVDPVLRFDAGIPSRAEHRAFQGLRTYGAYSLQGLERAPHLLLAYPSALHQDAERFWEKLLSGSGSYPGFARLFGMPPDRAPTIELKRLPSGEDSLNVQRLRHELDRWAATDRDREPDLAIVIVPHTERWVTETPYYVAKEFFAARCIPSQMVTQELLRNTGRLGWSLANIALAGFAKLGGVPWVVDARGSEGDLVIGVGRADISDDDGKRHRTFGYAVAFISSGAYISTHSRPPTADDRDYQERLTEAICEALVESRDTDVPVERIIIHLSRRTGVREVRAAQEALQRAGMNHMPVAFLRIDDSSLFEFLDSAQPTYAPPKGLTLRLSERRALVQVETSLGGFGPARRPLLVELDERSTIGPDEFGGLVLEVFRLGHANWRGFSARSKPVTLFYGERLAELVGYMNQRGEWDPAQMCVELRRRPWFL